MKTFSHSNYTYVGDQSDLGDCIWLRTNIPINPLIVLNMPNFNRKLHFCINEKAHKYYRWGSIGVDDIHYVHIAGIHCKKNCYEPCPFMNKEE